MKRILVFSDSHGDVSFCEKIINKIPSDMIIHAGDYDSDANRLVKKFPDKNIQYVAGNCDFMSNSPQNLIVELDNVKIYLAHGHNERVKEESDKKTLLNAAKNNGCDIAVFGHTHFPFNETEDGIMLINPGSSHYGKSYAIIEIENGQATACLMREGY